MPSGIQLSSGVLVGQPVPLDAKFGPYDTVALALADLTSGFRYQGLTVGIKSGNSIVEYWFKDGVADANFVEKVVAANWNTLLNKPSTFPPSTHTHQISEVTGLQTALDGKQPPATRSSIDLTGNFQLPSGRNRRVVMQPSVSSPTVDLPYEGNQSGDVITLIGFWPISSTITIRRALTVINGVAGFSAIATMSGVTGEDAKSLTFISDGTAIGWTLVTVDTHTHPASDISDSTAAGRALLTAATVQAQRTALETFVSAANLTAIQALTGNFQRVYIAQDTRKIYAWSGTGSVYTEISPHIKSDWNANSGDAQILNKPRSPYQLIAACSDETSLLTTGTKLVFRVFEMMFINTFRASVTQAPTGSSLVVQLRAPAPGNPANLQVYGTVTIPAGSTASSTSLNDAVIEYISDMIGEASPEFHIHVHQIGSTSAGRGLKIYLEGNRIL
jgi:hypothetical protein